MHAGERAFLTGSIGLGLSITKVLAEGMGASVAYSRKSGNTWFSIECVMETSGADESFPSPAAGVARTS